MNARASTGFHPPQPLTSSFPFSLYLSFFSHPSLRLLFLRTERPFSRLFRPFLDACGTAHERIYIYIYFYVCMYVCTYKRRDERRITRARKQRRHVHGGKLRPRSHIHRLAPRYSRSWYVGILNALHTVTCRRRHCSLHPSRLHLSPPLPDSLPARPHQHALS